MNSDDSQEINRLVSLLEEGRDRIEFFDAFRKSRLSCIPYHVQGVKEQHELAFKLLYEVGSISVSAGVALAMHLYLLGSIGSFPFEKESVSASVRDWFLEQVVKEQWIVAITGSVRTHNSPDDGGIHAEKTSEGYLINGHAGFMSLYDIADIAVLIASTSEGASAIFLIPLKDNAAVTGESSPFGELMRFSGTRRVKFESMHVESQNAFVLGENSEVNDVFLYQRGWFQSLVPAIYLGAAHSALQNAIDISRKKRTKSGVLLENLDGFQAAMGSLVMKHNAALAICSNTTNLLEDYGKSVTNIELDAFFEASALAKYFGTHYAEDCVLELRRLIGTAALTNPGIRETMNLILHGILHPISDFDAERYFGKKFIGKPASVG